MIGFEVIVNGTNVCKAGIGAPGDMRVNAIWVLRHSQEDLTGTPGTADESVGLEISGQAYAIAEIHSWPYTNLKTGDEVVIRVVDRESFDPPVGRMVIDRAKAERHQRELYEWLKRKFEPESQAEHGVSDKVHD